MFAHQYESNPAYRRWCDTADRTPGRVERVADIPAVPTSAFKELEFCCGTPAAEFRTSGTTGTGAGRHLAPSLEPYRQAALAWFRRCMLPEGWTLRMLVLAPPPDVAPHSSLTRMLAWVLEEYAEPGSGWYVNAEGLEEDRLAGALLDAQRAGGPTLVAGTTAALLAFCAYGERTGVALRLPGGSRLMDTGGQKGSGADAPVPLEEFQDGVRRRAERVLSIPPERCVNEYGMTELSSQFYDSVLADRLAGRAPRPGSGSARERVKLGPPWVRTDAVDPVTLEPLPAGEPGLLRHVDLANVGSVAAVLTEDFGRVVEDGLILEGRPRASEARGCGLTFADLARRPR